MGGPKGTTLRLATRKAVTQLRWSWLDVTLPPPRAPRPAPNPARRARCRPCGLQASPPPRSREGSSGASTGKLAAAPAWGAPGSRALNAGEGAAWQSCAHQGVRACDTGQTEGSGKGRPLPWLCPPQRLHVLRTPPRGPFAHSTPRQLHREELPDCTPALRKCPSAGRENAASRREACAGRALRPLILLCAAAAWPGPARPAEPSPSAVSPAAPSDRNVPVHGNSHSGGGCMDRWGGCPLPSLEGFHHPKSYSEAFRPVLLARRRTCTRARPGNQVPASHHSLSVLPLPQPLHLPPRRLRYPTCFPTSTYTPSVGVCRPLTAGRRSGKARLRVSEVRSWGPPSPSDACTAHRRHAATHFQHIHTCCLKIIGAGPRLDKCSGQHFLLAGPKKLILVYDILEAFFLVIF